jgi:VWFA-related protein
LLLASLRANLKPHNGDIFFLFNCADRSRACAASVSDSEHREYEVIDRAVCSHVIISTLDTRGVYTEENEVADENILSEFADGTGGNFFHNNNDLDEGLRRVASPPEFVYQLGFYPKDLQEDGKYHHLKVKIAGTDKLSVSARGGYFAPTAMAD